MGLLENTADAALKSAAKRTVTGEVAQDVVNSATTSVAEGAGKAVVSNIPVARTVANAANLSTSLIADGLSNAAKLAQRAGTAEIANGLGVAAKVASGPWGVGLGIATSSVSPAGAKTDKLIEHPEQYAPDIHTIASSPILGELAQKHPEIVNIGADRTHLDELGHVIADTPTSAAALNAEKEHALGGLQQQLRGLPADAQHGLMDSIDKINACNTSAVSPHHGKGVTPHQMLEDAAAVQACQSVDAPKTFDDLMKSRPTGMDRTALRVENSLGSTKSDPTAAGKYAALNPTAPANEAMPSPLALSHLRAEAAKAPAEVKKPSPAPEQNNKVGAAAAQKATDSWNTGMGMAAMRQPSLSGFGGFGM